VRYSIDTSSLINGFRIHYPYENFPRLWNRDLPALVAAGDLRATEEVRVELDRQDDELVHALGIRCIRLMEVIRENAWVYG
jgi:hypothetical protein